MARSRLAFLAPVLMALALTAGCQSIGAALNAVNTVVNLDVANPVTPARVFQLRALYATAFLVPAVAYRELPLCGPGERTIPHGCAERAVVLRLQAVDRQAEAAMVRLETFVRDNPRLNALSLFQAAEQAVATARSAVPALR